MVAVAQLVRAPDCGSGCRGFEFHRLPKSKMVCVVRAWSKESACEAE